MEKNKLEEWHAYWLAEQVMWFKSIGLEEIKIREHKKTELSHYSSATFDIDYEYSFGSKEIAGNANRGQYDLTQHQKESGQDLSIFDEKAGKIIAETILEIVKSKEKYKSCIVLGGGHYNQTAKKMMLNSEYAVGHVCAKYNLENLNEEMLKQMIERSDDKIELAILDWKGLGQYKQKVKSLLEEFNIEIKRNDKI